MHLILCNINSQLAGEHAQIFQALCLYRELKMPTRKQNNLSPSSTPQTTPALFAEQAAKTPAAPAVRYEQSEWTYAELAARVNRLTRYLQSRKIGKGSRVSIVSG